MTIQPFLQKAEKTRDERADFDIPDEIEHFFDKENDIYTPEMARADSAIFILLDEQPDVPATSLKIRIEAIMETEPDENLLETGGFVDLRIKKILDQRDRITELTKEFTEPEELFEKLFGKPPVGKVQLVPDPISINFICHDIFDLEHIYEQKYLEEQQTRKIYQTSIAACTIKKSLDPRADNAVVAALWRNPAITNNSLDSNEKVLEHERRHIKSWLLADEYNDEKLKNIPTPEEFAQLPQDGFAQQLDEYLVICRELSYEMNAKFELEAYLDQGLDIDHAVQMVIENYQIGEKLSARLKSSLGINLSEEALDELNNKIDKVFENYDAVILQTGMRLKEMRTNNDTLDVLAMRLENTHIRQLI